MGLTREQRKWVPGWSQERSLNALVREIRFDELKPYGTPFKETPASVSTTNLGAGQVYTVASKTGPAAERLGQ